MLYEQANKRSYDEFVLMAKLHGAKIKGGEPLKDPDEYDDEFGDFVYNGDPETVKHFTDEQRRRLTEKLVGKFKGKHAELMNGLKPKQ